MRVHPSHTLPVAEVTRDSDIELGDAAPITAHVISVAPASFSNPDHEEPPLGICVLDNADDEIPSESGDGGVDRLGTAPWAQREAVRPKRDLREMFFDEPLTRPISRWFDEDHDCVCCATLSSGLWTLYCHGTWIALKITVGALCVGWLTSRSGNGVQARSTVVLFLLCANALLYWCVWCGCICVWNVAFVSPTWFARCMDNGYTRHSEGGSLCAVLSCLLCLGCLLLACGVVVE